MKKFPSILQDKNNDDISNVVNSISDNRRCKLKSIKNVVELPDVWKRTNSYISSKNSIISKSTSINTATTTINDEYKLSFDFSLSNNRHNNNNNHSQLSLVKNNNKIGLAGLGLNNSPSSSTKMVKNPNKDNATLLIFHYDDKNVNLFDVGVAGGFEYWDGGKPNLL